MNCSFLKSHPHPFTRSFAATPLSTYSDSILDLSRPLYRPCFADLSGEDFAETQQWISAVERYQGEEVGIRSSDLKAKRHERERVDLTCGLVDAAPTVQKRSSPRLTYKFDDEFPDAAKPAMLRAFASWEEPLNFTFSLCFEGEPDIIIGMFKGEHGDLHPFEAGPGGVLAHATFPPHGHLHFNREQLWWYDLDPSVAGDERFIDFQSVAVHEVGHLLGVEHIDNRDAVMYAFLRPGEVKRGLTEADVAALKHIYAGDTNFD